MRSYMLCMELAFFPASFDYCKTLNAKQKKLGSQRREATETCMMPIYISVYMKSFRIQGRLNSFSSLASTETGFFLSPIHAHGSNLVPLKWLFSFDRPFPVISKPFEYRYLYSIANGQIQSSSSQTLSPQQHNLLSSNE